MGGAQSVPFAKEALKDGHVGLNAISKGSGHADGVSHQILLLACGCCMEWADLGQSRPAKGRERALPTPRN